MVKNLFDQSDQKFLVESKHIQRKCGCRSRKCELKLFLFLSLRHPLHYCEKWIDWRKLCRSLLIRCRSESLNMLKMLKRASDVHMFIIAQQCFLQTCILKREEDYLSLCRTQLYLFRKNMLSLKRKQLWVFQSLDSMCTAHPPLMRCISHTNGHFDSVVYWKTISSSELIIMCILKSKCQH